MDKYQQTIDTFNHVADLYWEKFKSFKPYEPTYDWFCEHLPAGPIDLLEIACGPGNVSRYLLDKNSQINLFGIDLAPNMITLAKKHNPSANFAVMDCRDILTINQTFDAIMCGFCLPYLSWQDSQTLIQDMVKMLNLDGLLYLSVTVGDKSDEGFKGSKSNSGSVYVHYHDIGAISDCLVACGLKLHGQQEITHMHNNQATVDVFIMAKKSI